MDIGTLLMMLVLSYALGILWYDLLPGKLPQLPWRVAAYPFLGIFVAEILLREFLTIDLAFGGVHLVTAFVGSLVAVIVDWAITQARHPMSVLQPEPRTT
ncbi:MAG TPA: hypothetical protein VI789_07865 [Dehalococcoidia bacterium]|nr:hypothetical protein [Dehalococcoidia bacterium]